MSVNGFGMSSETLAMHIFVLKQCQEAGYPCVPDLNDPIVAVKYIVTKWLGHDGRNSIEEYVNRAINLGFVCCEIKRHQCMRLSDAHKLVIDEKRPAKKKTKKT